jgi:hypothetical protein
LLPALLEPEKPASDLVSSATFINGEGKTANP